MFRIICTVAWTVAFVVTVAIAYMHFQHVTKPVMTQALLIFLLSTTLMLAFFVGFKEWIFSFVVPACVVAGLIVLSIHHPLWSVLFYVLILGTLSWLAREEHLDTPNPSDCSLSGIKIPGRGVVMISMAGRTPRDINEEIRCYRRNAKKCS